MEENQKLNLNWSAVEKALAEGTFSGYKIGILETEKLFVAFLIEKNIPGTNIDTKIKYVVKFLSRLPQLRYAREIYKKIIEQPHFEISREETTQVIQGYWQAMLDLTEAISTLSLRQKLIIRLKYFIGQMIKRFKITVAAFFGILLLTLFFYELEIGRSLALKIGQAAHFFVFKIGPWILGVIAAIFFLWLATKLLKKKRQF